MKTVVPIVTEAAAPQGVSSVPVTVDNFIRAETDLMLGGAVTDDGFGKYFHNRAPTPIEHQPVIRMNRDTLYSGAVFDLDAGPVTVTLPESGGKFMSLQVISEDHYTPMVVYKSGPVTLTRDNVGTRYVLTAIRTLVNPNDPKDVELVHKLQDAIKVEQHGGPGKFEVLNWDKASQKKVRDALLALNETMPDLRNAMGKNASEVDPVRRLIASASGWGLNPDKEAIYLNVMPGQNDGKTPYTLTVKDVPVDGFWSISVYNKAGFFEKNSRDAYTFNNVTAKPNADSSITIHFGGDEKASNFLPITAGWNYMVRLYRPRKEILEGKWKFPEATTVK